MWFYLEGEQRRGPITAEELVKALLAGASPRSVFIWRAGMPEWQEAGSVPEINERLSAAGVTAHAGSGTKSSVPENAEEIAKFYRFLVLLVGIQILLNVFLLPSQMAPSSRAGAFASVIGLALIFLLATISFAAYHLTRLLGESLPVLWAIVMFMPCLNLIGLLMISSKAQVWCRQYGIEVGLLGPTKESIEELRRRMAP